MSKREVTRFKIPSRKFINLINVYHPQRIQNKAIIAKNRGYSALQNGFSCCKTTACNNISKMGIFMWDNFGVLATIKPCS